MSYRLFFANVFVAISFSLLAFMAAPPMSLAGAVAAPVMIKSLPQIPAIDEEAGMFAKYQTAGTFKSKPKRKKVRCNGATTATCCFGLSYCTCLYAPGRSSDNHPTTCSSIPPSNG